MPRPVGGPLVGVRAWALATHLGPTVAVTTVATLLAVGADVSGARAALVGIAVLAGQASIGWSNDWLDADRDRAVARADKPVVRGAVRPAQLRSLALAAAALSVVLSLVVAVPGLLLWWAAGRLRTRSPAAPAVAHAG